MRDAEIVVDAFFREHHFEALAGEQIIRGPGLRVLGDAQGMTIIFWAIGRRGVDILIADPAHSRAR